MLEYGYIYNYLFIFSIFFFVFLVTVILFFIKKAKFKENRIRSLKILADFKAIFLLLLILLGISFLGMTIGILAGNSRSPAINVVISSVLTIFAGVNAFLYSKINSKLKLFAGLSIIIISLTIPYGAISGARIRMNYEAEERKYNEDYEKEIIELKNNFELYNYEQKKKIDLEYMYREKKIIE